MSSSTAEPVTEITEADLEEIYEIYTKLYQSFEANGKVDESLKSKFQEKLKVIPETAEIVENFEKLLLKIEKEAHKERNEEKKKPGDGPIRIKRQAAPLNPPAFETEKKQTCIELFADFGSFFNRSISKVGLKYCSESEIVRRSDILTSFNAATSGQ
jgi:hypothetical protein